MKDDNKAIKFRVENSWGKLKNWRNFVYTNLIMVLIIAGEDRGEKGYLVMSADWFKEFVFEIVVDKSIVPKDVLDVFSQVPILLPAWDPMGTLAKNWTWAVCFGRYFSNWTV